MKPGSAQLADLWNKHQQAAQVLYPEAIQLLLLVILASVHSHLSSSVLELLEVYESHACQSALMFHVLSICHSQSLFFRVVLLASCLRLGFKLATWRSDRMVIRHSTCFFSSAAMRRKKLGVHEESPYGLKGSGEDAPSEASPSLPPRSQRWLPSWLMGEGWRGLHLRGQQRGRQSRQEKAAAVGRTGQVLGRGVLRGRARGA